MADQKLKNLTSDASPTLDDLLYLLNDPAGTPADRKVALSAIATLFAGAAAFSGAYAPKDLGAVFYTGSTSLTNTTPNNLSFVQWGTEEAVIAQADAPASAVVMVWLAGDLVPFADATAGERGQARIEVSFDGGSTWATVGSDAAPPLHAAVGSAISHYFTAHGRITGTVTGDIQARALCRDVDDTNSCTFDRGVISILVHPQ